MVPLGARFYRSETHSHDISSDASASAVRWRESEPEVVDEKKHTSSLPIGSATRS